MALSSHPLPPLESDRNRADTDAADDPSPSSVRPRSARQAPPTRLLEGRYALERYLDRGGTSKVYLAYDEVCQENVVVKILNEHAWGSHELRAHFLRGSRAALAVDHPNVVQVLAVREPPSGAPYMVMEPLRGELLADLLVRQPTLAEQAALCVTKQAAEGLSALHAAGIVHCDIKPENLFVVGALSEPESLKILDFGLAAVGGEDAIGDSHSVRGTAQYMAPEQVLGDPVDGRTDVYALGMVLFRMLTGHLPFDLKLSVTLLRHQLFSPVPPPSWLNEELGPDVERIVHKALCKDPDNRYASASELVRAIEAVLAGSRDSEPTAQRRPDIYVPRTPRGEHSARLLGRHSQAESA